MAKSKVVKISKNKDLKLISINIPVELLNHYSEYSKQLGVARSNLMVIALNEYLVNRDIVSQLPQLLEELQSQKKNSKRK